MRLGRSLVATESRSDVGEHEVIIVETTDVAQMAVPTPIREKLQCLRLFLGWIRTWKNRRFGLMCTTS